MHDLTDVIAAFHGTAAITPGYGGRAGIEETFAGNPINLLSSPPLDLQSGRAQHCRRARKCSQWNNR
jgi:hypothetical protein